MKYRMLNVIIKSKIIQKNRQFLNYLSLLNNTWENKSRLSNSDLKLIERNKIFNNIHKNKRAFIIANGPSLNKQDLYLVKDDITFVMNGFHRHKIIGDWQPSYYCLIDPEFFKDFQDTFVLYNEINKKITSAKFLIPLSRGYGFIKKYNLLPLERTYYCAIYGNFNIPSIELTNLMPRFQTVAAFAISAAIYMGCNPIYLMGFDHDYLAHKGTYQHFYQGGDGMRGKKSEALINNLFENVFSYYDSMKFMMQFWENYIYLKKIASKLEIEIINATEGGYLDVFNRSKYENIFKLA